jgi:hypothetical protein
LPDEPYHEVEFTVGLRATYAKDGTIMNVKGIELWQGKPNVIPTNMRLLRVTVDVPESFFAVSAHVKGRLESRLEEELAVLIEELES